MQALIAAMLLGGTLLITPVASAQDGAAGAEASSEADKTAAEERATQFVGVTGAEAENIPGGGLLLGAYAFFQANILAGGGPPILDALAWLPDRILPGVRWARVNRDYYDILACVVLTPRGLLDELCSEVGVNLTVELRERSAQERLQHHGVEAFRAQFHHCRAVFVQSRPPVDPSKWATGRDGEDATLAGEVEATADPLPIGLDLPGSIADWHSAHGGVLGFEARSELRVLLGARID